MGFIQPYLRNKPVRSRNHLSTNDPLFIPCLVVQLQNLVHGYALQFDTVGGLNWNFDGPAERHGLSADSAVISVVVSPMKLGCMAGGIVHDIHDDVGKALLPDRELRLATSGRVSNGWTVTMYPGESLPTRYPLIIQRTKHRSKTPNGVASFPRNTRYLCGEFGPSLSPDVPRPDRRGDLRMCRSRLFLKRKGRAEGRSLWIAMTSSPLMSRLWIRIH